MKVLLAILLIMVQGIIPKGPAYMKQLQPRDSILIADQIEYGFELDSLAEGTLLALPDFSKFSNDTLTVVENWRIDTLKVTGGRRGSKGLLKLRGRMVLAAFEEGKYELPAIPVQLTSPTGVDTLIYESLEIDVKTMPVDTATYEIHDIKGQMKYPLTFRELLPYLIGIVLLAGLAVLVTYLVRRKKAAGEDAHKDPAYIVALRKLDQFRGDKYWAPEKQKAFYSGITDTLREYMADRFTIDAQEMTTAEIFTALKGNQDITPELYNETKDLFETADFVKFAKHVASDADNAAALPSAVRFVTSTYQLEVEEESGQNTDKEE